MAQAVDLTALDTDVLLNILSGIDAEALLCLALTDARFSSKTYLLRP